MRVLQDMRDAKRHNRRRRPATDAPEIGVDGVDANPAPGAEEQELLEQGLRILARLAVRAYLRGEVPPPATDLAERRIDNPAAD